MKKMIAGLVLPLALFAGCGETQFAKDCKADGGKVETESEKCGTKRKQVSAKPQRFETVAKYKTEYECIIDGKEVREDEGACS